jgi:hypothetical protein
MINPEAERAVRAATESAKAAVSSLGKEKMLGLAGGLLGLLGSVLPYYTAGYSIPGFSAETSTSLFHIGTQGVAVLILAIVLGLAPMTLIFSRLAALIGFGLSAGVLGEIVLGYMAIPSYGFGFYGIGFYCALIGFAILAYVYGRRVLTPLPQERVQ